MSTRSLNRALLARQHLLRRSPMSGLGMTEHLIALQAQEPFPPYYGLWARCEAAPPEELSRHLEERRAVRMHTLRGTVQLSTAEDAVLLRSWTAGLIGGRFMLEEFPDSEWARLDGETHRLLSDRPRTVTELGAELELLFPDYWGTDLGRAAVFGRPCVQVPPRATWPDGGRGEGRRARWTTARHWLGSGEPEPDLGEIGRRYLRAFGPAAGRDLSQWSGMSGGARILDLIRDELVTLEDEQGRELLDLPDAPRPDPDTAAPVRLLPAFDNILLAHQERSRIIPPEYRHHVTSYMPGTVLVDGFAVGDWRLELSTRNLIVNPLGPELGKAEEEVRSEGEALLAFAYPDGAGVVEIGAAP